MPERGLADIAFHATVRAEELRFEQVPGATVTFSGSPDRTSVSDSVRTHLPEHAEAGVDYQDICVDYTLATALLDEAYPPRAGADEE